MAEALNLHQSDPVCFEADAEGWYTARCECGWSFGPLPDVETMVDALMAHAAEMASS